MLGNNPKRQPLKGDGSALEVKNIFKTIQGEGPLVGVPAVFIRLGGCNLACSFCDTDFENYNEFSLVEIITKISALSTNSDNKRVINLIVITGGEPMRQPIEALCKALLELNYNIQIETNGTIYRALPSAVQIVCSPKAGIKDYHVIREDLLPNISAFKFLIAKKIHPYNNVPELGQTKHNIPVYIQPIDQYNEVLNKENDTYAVELALEHGYKLSLQIHKFLNIE